MTKIREVIVVEGKDDTKRIQLAVDADTLETRGSAIDDETLNQIEELQNRRGVIVFTDPDFSGEKIRKTIQAEIPGVKHAFLNRRDARPEHKGSLGVEHASVEAIREALGHLYTEEFDTPVLINRKELVNNGLLDGEDSKLRRRLLGEELHIGYTNGKQLYKRLKLFQITPEEFSQAMEKVNHRIKVGDTDEY